ncbi:DsbA family protein [Litorilituus lipolyticus]|nr:DsbA family protein [Litorilituus lipolyticus]
MTNFIRMTTLFYIYDPMCSWCWGYRPVWDEIQQQLSSHVNVEYVAGGLAADSSEPMPASQQRMIQQHWHTIEHKLGTKFNHDFWRDNIPRRSTYNACRAVIAAKIQGLHIKMIDAIQRGYYLKAMNPSDSDILLKLAEEIAEDREVGLNIEKFKEDFISDELELKLTKEISLARQLSSQGFPSLVLSHQGQLKQLLIDYQNAQATVSLIEALLD